MYQSEQENDSRTDIYQRYRSSPLEWLASMPVLSPRQRPLVRGAMALLALVLFTYWLGPRWGHSPFYSRNVDFDSNFSLLQEVALPDVAIETAPLSTVTLNLLGSWPGWRVAQYADGRHYLVTLSDHLGQMQWAQRVDQKPTWTGDWRLVQQDSGWAWFGGWRVAIASPQIAQNSALFLSPGGDARVVRHLTLTPPK
ncbi:MULTISPECIES: hypothetical protein [Silvimonas]|uniref:hypothetical protein n=1 Tax=Silvimonas TaxID=300264 RepID=UPI0024B351CE|nr:MULTISPECIES: hypothetical protein [Silvimonas]MDR3427656.1 hypothetical protein [Silvimonas sp.]